MDKKQRRRARSHSKTQNTVKSRRMFQPYKFLSKQSRHDFNQQDEDRGHNRSMTKVSKTSQTSLLRKHHRDCSQKRLKHSTRGAAHGMLTQHEKMNLQKMRNRIRPRARQANKNSSAQVEGASRKQNNDFFASSFSKNQNDRTEVNLQKFAPYFDRSDSLVNSTLPKSSKDRFTAKNSTLDKVDALQADIDSLKSRVVSQKARQLQNEIKALKS